MKRRVLLIFILTFIVAASMGCATILADDNVTETPHVGSPMLPPQEAQVEVSNFNELKDAIIELIKAHETTARFISMNYETEDVQADLERAIHEILTYHPLGVYAVGEIVGQATKIVAFVEINISIEYMRTSQQVSSIVEINSIDDLHDQLLRALREYRVETVLRTPLQLSVEEIISYIDEIYYQNPRKIVMRPIVAVDLYPEQGEDRIISLRFGLFRGAPPSLLRSMQDSLSLMLQTIASEAQGETDAEILLSLANHLIVTSNFDEANARTIAGHGMQNTLATAFGALVNAQAIGEGFAMAFQALCDELGLDSRVLLGYLDGRPHAWNLVMLSGYYYHIDVSMGDLHGIETAFLKNDSQLRAMGYTWNQENTPRAMGWLTYQDVAEHDEMGEDDEADEPGQNAGQDRLSQPRPPVMPGTNQPPGHTAEPDGDADIPEESDEPIEPEYPDEPSEPDEYPSDSEEPDESEETEAEITQR